MIIFEGAAVYDSISGVLRISEDQATFESPSNDSSFKLQFVSDPRNRTYRFTPALSHLSTPLALSLFPLQVFACLFMCSLGERSFLTLSNFFTGVISVFRKSKRIVFTVNDLKHSFTILEEDPTNDPFERCISAVKTIVDPIAVEELRRGYTPSPLTSTSSSELNTPSSTPPPQSIALSPRSALVAPTSVAPSIRHSEPSIPSSRHHRSSSPERPSEDALSSTTRSATSSLKRSDTFLFVEVKVPLVEGGAATYLVSHRTNMKEFGIAEGEVRRRYSQFEALHSALTSRFSKLSSVPELPVKTWFKRFDPAFLEQRTRELNMWLKAIALDEYMHKSVELVHFLTDQAPVSVAGPSGYVEKLIRPLVDNQMVVNIGDTINGTVAQVLHRNGSATASSTHHNTLVVGSPLERDYLTARSLMEQWKLTPKKLPFPKFVTLLLGSTSSGKSAFVNHHFGCVARKSTDHQQDTDFTVVEVIPAAEFYALSGTKERIVHKSQAMMHPDAFVIDDDLLKRPIEDYESDWRTGRIFIRLNSTQLLGRYEQLRPYAKDGLFRACLINEAALDRTAPTFDLACNSILIDSPGFSTIQSAEIAEKFRGTLVVLQYLYNMCDLLLYFVPCGQISTLAQHLPMLELALTYASHGEKIGDEMLKTLFSKHLQDAKSSGGGFLSFCSSIASSIISQASYGKNSSSNASSSEPAQQFKGASVWHKTLFVLSKIDILFRQTKPSHWNRTLLSQYYELGVLLGSSLSLLDPPVHDQCITIGLPEYITPNSLPYENTPVPPTADLDLLMAKMQGREQEAPYIERLEMAIQQMCSDLEKAMSSSYLTMGQHQTMLELRARSETRNKTRQTGYFPNR